MDESRKQFEEYWDNYTGSRDGRCKSLRSGAGYRNKSANECWVFWQASRQEQSIFAYLTHQGSAVSPDDFEGGEAEMHETAKREEWFPLVKKGD